MVVSRFFTGQRWLSQTEPELGLGLVLKTESTMVSIVFPSTETSRVYTMEGPPLTRVKFSVGDILKTQDGKNFVVDGVEETNGIITYISKGKRIEESALSDSLTFSKPYDRLLNAQVEEKQVFNLRHRALYRRFKTFRAPLRGLLNGRFAARAHQLHVAVQATRMQHPRVLLCDEPGLGKTIEAGLILQRTHTFAHARRVLLVGPEATLARTEIEFRRRFDFKFKRITLEDFAIKPAKKVTKKSAKAVVKSAPFASETPDEGEEEATLWASVSLEELAGNRGKLLKEAIAVTWDMVVIPGAEQLKWNDAGGNPWWLVVESLSTVTLGLILMSDEGPEHDHRSHFGRLHFLDPETFASPRKMSAHRKETEPLEAAILGAMSATECSEDLEVALSAFATDENKVKDMLKAWKDGREEQKEYLIDYLLDAHESGRMVFRNKRANVKGLPERVVEFVTMAPKPEVRDLLKAEFKAHGKTVEPAKGKPKAEPSALDSSVSTWLAALVSPAPPPLPLAPGEIAPPPPPPPVRALVIVDSRNRAAAVEKALRTKVDGTIELVTDQLRVDPGVAPRVVIVGQEDLVGRSFPGFDIAVLWDVPLTIEDTRERLFTCDHSFVGKLPLMIPLVEDTPQAMTARWLHEGLAAFSSATDGQVPAAEEHSKAVHDLVKKIGAKHNAKLDEDLHTIILKTTASHDSILKRLEKHEDAFLNAVSLRHPSADQAFARMNSTDDDESLDAFMNRTLEILGILVETKNPRVVFVKPNPECQFRFEDVAKEGATYTFSRSTSCTREDALFLTWDHPLVSSAIDKLLSTPTGNTAYVVWEDERAQVVLMEAIYLARPKTGPHRDLVARYMPPTPVRVVLSHEYADMSSEYTSEVVNKMVRNGRREWIRNNARPLHNILPGMIRVLNLRAEARMVELAAKAAFQMDLIIQSDINRLKRLPETKLRKAAIARLVDQINVTKPLFETPSLVLDQLRLLRRGPSGKGI